MAGGAAEDTPARPEGKAGAPDTAGRTSNRKRKQAEFYNPGDAKATEKLVIKEGEGLKLGSIPNVAFQFSRVTGSDELMEELHQILFKRKGKAQTRKKDILGFSGIVYEGDKEGERAKYAEKLGRLKVDDVHRLLDLMDIVPRGTGSKEAKVGTLLDFLEKPKALRDVNLAERAEKKKKAKKGKAAPKKGGKKAAKKGEDAVEEDDDADEDEEEEQEEEKAPPAKKKAAPAAKKEEQPKKRKAAKAPDAGKKKAKTKAQGEPKEAAQEPSNEVLAAEIRDIVAGVNVQEFSLKDLMARLEEKYGVSLKKRKTFIKDTVAECTQSKQDAPEEEEGEKPEEPANDGAAEAEPSPAEEAAVAAPEAPAEPAAEPAAEPMDEDAPAAEAAPDAALAATPEAAPATEPALAEEPIPEEAAAGAPAGDAGNMAVDDKAVENMTADQAAASVAAENMADAAVEKAAAGDATSGIAPAPEAAP